MNEQIRKLHKRLGKTVQALSTRLGKATDPDEAEAILREMEEVNFRVMMAGRLLFRRTTARIDGQIDRILESADQVDDAIRSFEERKELIRATGKLLTLVDKALDAAKALAV